MKVFLALCCVLFLCGSISAQATDGHQFNGDIVPATSNSSPSTPSIVLTPSSLPSQSLEKGEWEIGLLGGGGSGVGYASGTRFVYAGARVGRILTGDHFSGLGRGNFEWAVEILPVYTIFTAGRTVYGGSFKPAIWKYNFVSGGRVAPYVLIAGGIVFSTGNIPLGNTSWVNFSPQAAVGAHFLSRSRQSLFMEASYVHHSNAGLSAFNPGYNASLFFTIGYDWFKGRNF